MLAPKMLAAHPQVGGNVDQALVRCIEDCFDCAQTCTSCADACLAEDMVAEMRQCIRLCLDCADVCGATGRLATRRTGSDERLLRRIIEICAEACRLCGEECSRHADKMEHCRICAEACRKCEQSCRDAAGAVG